MASNEEGQRKKRAWRKPREPITPDSEDNPATTKPIKLQRNVKTTTSSAHVHPTDASPQDGVDIGKKRLLLSDDDVPLVKQTSESGRSIEGRGVAMKDTLEIDGSIMEGGGQILRIATALSCLLTRPIHVARIRAGRSNPGLRPQHLSGLKLLAELCGGRLEGAEVGSSEVTFKPRTITGGDFMGDTKTAGSISLLLQATLPVLLFANNPSKVTLRGGTNADMAPPIDYLLMVFQVIAAKFGVRFNCRINKRGFYPKGRGEVEVTATPIGKALSSVVLTDPGMVVKIRMNAFTAGAVPKKISREMINSARREIRHYLSSVDKIKDVTFEEEETQETPSTAFGNGSGIIVIAETTSGCYFAGSSNGKKGDSAEKTGRLAGEELVRHLREGGCVDEHLQDQLIIFMALAEGTSKVRTGPITLHTETAIHIAEVMTNGKAKFTIESLTGGSSIIHCSGIGLKL